MTWFNDDDDDDAKTPQPGAGAGDYTTEMPVPGEPSEEDVSNSEQ